MIIQIEKQIDYLYEYSKDVFQKDTVLIRNLEVIKRNVDLEWFNCLLIAANTNMTQNSRFVVHTLNEWATFLDRTIILNKMEPVHLLAPFYDPDREELLFFEHDVYCMDHFQLEETDKEPNDVALEKIKRSFGFENLRKILRDGWQERFISDYLQLFSFYKEALEKEQLFYGTVLKLVFGKNLYLEKHLEISGKGLIEMTSQSANKMNLYIQMYKLITEFHVYFAQWLLQVVKLQARHKKTSIYDRTMAALEMNGME